MIRAKDNNFILETDNTTYAFRVTGSGHLEHMYYGRKISLGDVDVITEKSAFCPGTSLNYTQDDLSFSLEDICLEASGQGKGDIREPFCELVHADGSRTCDFVYDSYTLKDENPHLYTMPCSYSANKLPAHLTVVLKDKYYDIALELHYFVYEKCNVITRYTKLINNSGDDIRLLKLMSTQLDFSEKDLVLTTFNGAWAREMGKNETKVVAGKSRKLQQSWYKFK